MNKQEFNCWRSDWPETLEGLADRKTLVMGILNLTPDSFSDGGKFIRPEQAIVRAGHMISEGVDLIDIGGESSRPGAKAISSEEELDRVLPVIELLCQEFDCCISVDTTKPIVMREALKAGAFMINDISFLGDEGALAVASEFQPPLCLMHMQGSPESMQNHPSYSASVVDVINDYFKTELVRVTASGVHSTQIILDPGFGFGKTVAHNLLIIKQINQFLVHGLPLMLGVSRKSTLGAVTGAPVDQRLSAGLSIAVYAVERGVRIIRTHDVAETKQALCMLEAVIKAH